MIRELTARQARRLRWQAQLLGASTLEPAAVVEAAVALQGQDLAAVLRAIAIRSRPGTTVADVRAAFDAGLLVRSWPIRGTLFATTPRRLAALLFFTADRMHRAAARSRAQLGLDEQTLARGRDVLAEALSERPLLRAEALAALESSGIATAGGRGYHLIIHQCVSGRAYWGAFHGTGTEQLLTAAALTPPADPEGALSGAVRDFAAFRGPVTEADLTWWTKLPKSTLRQAVAKADLVEVTVDGVPAWVVSEPEVPEPSGVTLVPGFDEWILGYADRSLHASRAALDALVPGRNGVFRPAVLVDGVVVGTWRSGRPGTASGAAAELVEKISPGTRRAIDAALAAWTLE